MDYLDHLDWQRHEDWGAFCSFKLINAPASRLVLLSTRSTTSLYDFAFRADDWLLMGAESGGVPEAVHAAADRRLRIPLRPHTRSLNVAVAAAMGVGEALRQTRQLPEIVP